MMEDLNLRLEELLITALDMTTHSNETLANLLSKVQSHKQLPLSEQRSQMRNNSKSNQTNEKLGIYSGKMYYG